MSLLPPRIPTPKFGMPAASDGGAPHPQKIDHEPSPTCSTSASSGSTRQGGSSRPGSRSASPSPFFGIVMPTPPSFDKLLPNKGEADPAGAEAPGAAATSASHAVGRHGDGQEQEPELEPRTTAAPSEASGPGLRVHAATTTSSSGAGQQQSVTSSASQSSSRLPTSHHHHPHVVRRQTTDDAADDARGGGLCGGLGAGETATVLLGAAVGGRCECHPDDDDYRSAASGVGYNDSAMTNAMIPRSLNDHSNASSESLARDAKCGTDVAEPYAVHHDEIVTALIDEALRNGGSRGEGAGSRPVTPPPAPTERSVAESNPVGGGGDSASHAATEEKSDSGGGGTSTPSKKNLKPTARSPNRMKRGASMQIKLRKKQRSNVGDGDRKASNNNATTKTSLAPVANSCECSPKSSPANNDRSAGAVADFLHPDCILQKEKGQDNGSVSVSGVGRRSKLGFGADAEGVRARASASGREETLAKLRKKLSMLGEIESGKFGRAAEMLRSDAIAFLRDDGGRAAAGGAYAAKKVETRSVLTLKMGFVSMSYGILLQWDRASGLVELIVLKKMCRDDFLNPSSVDPSMLSRSSRRVNGNSVGLSSSLSSSPKGGGGKPPLVPNKKPEQIAPPRADVDNNCQGSKKRGGGDADLRKNKSINLGGMPSSADPDHSGAMGRSAMLPKLSTVPQLPSNPLASIARFLTGVASASAAGLTGLPHNNNNNNDNKRHDEPKYFLSVSVLKVTRLHAVCDSCRNPDSVGRMMNGARLGKLSKRKRKHPTIRPYIRFVLGKHEHRTKVTKFNKGHPTWGKRHNNSCLLPCPPEELRWFAGREDLIVEVRNDWKHHGGGLGMGVKQSSGLRSHHHRSLRAGSGSPSSDDRPILAAVTVPLSSVNIEDDDEANNKADEEDGPGTRYNPAAGGLDKKGTWKHKTTRDGASSTNVTIPLRMVSCRSAPVGSISLKITIKVPSADEREEHAARNGNSASTSSGSSTPILTLTKPDIQVETTFDKSGDETKVNESIELGPLTRFMDGWSLGGGAAQPSSSSKENNGKKESGKSVVTTVAVKSKSQRKNRKPTTPPRRENKFGTEGNKQQETKHKNLRWSKQFDHKSKQWSAFNNNPAGDGSAAASALALAPPPTRKKTDDASSDNSRNNEGWFAFLSNQHAG
eukprot:CAMPEP_0181137638 /NCGR_PEP_ID=MMETSP1071-20121207/33808_1 /TAXON_ID=35127 /ORGANISM="Thalassiosira sp., Strain NH16" /LENGTH=1157 /DNA_ID=CAMNT_0023224397 /DNA_START=255 /DNA_END=3729 /DNA_ORIENTATION=+